LSLGRLTIQDFEANCPDVNRRSLQRELKGLVSELEEICPEVTRRTLQRDLNNLIEQTQSRLIREKGY